MGPRASEWYFGEIPSAWTQVASRITSAFFGLDPWTVTGGAKTCKLQTTKVGDLDLIRGACSTLECGCRMPACPTVRQSRSLL